LRRITPEQRQTIRKEYGEWQKKVRVLPTVLLLLIAGLCAYIISYESDHKGLHWKIVVVFSFAVGFYALEAGFKREGHWEWLQKRI